MSTKSEQLEKLKKFRHEVFGGDSIDGDFDYAIFSKREKRKDTVRVIFEDYVIRPFDGFDLHDRFNNGIAPKHKIMYGKILKETDKMYELSLASDRGDDLWRGWCYKKSVTVEKLDYES